MEISEEAREKREAYAADRACDAAGLTEVERLTRECGDLRERIRIAMSALSVASARAVNAEAERDDLLEMKARMEALADDFMTATEAADGDTRTAQFMRDLRDAIRDES